MFRAYVTLVMLPFALFATAYSQEPMPLGKGTDLGPLGEHFEVLSSEVSLVRAEGGYGIILKLKAKKDVDTTEFLYKVGVFDKGKFLLTVAPLQFAYGGFPLLKGESTQARCYLELPKPEEGFPWHKLSIRAVKPPK